MYRVSNNASHLQYFRMVKCILSILTIIVISFLFLGWLVGFRAKENPKISRLFFFHRKKDEHRPHGQFVTFDSI